MLLRQIYYFLKPTLPRKLRLVFRRFQAKRLRRRHINSWPISQVAGRAPDGWPGWPDGKEFAFVLTHDVEGKKGLDRCRDLAEMEMRLGFRSSFNFVPEGEYATPESIRDFLATHGFEVGVHDLRHDGSLYSSRKKFAANAQKINHYLEAWQAVGFRSAFMFHDLPWLQDLNILYDASTFDTDPFEPQPDGVNTIFPFWISRNDGSGYVELPYTLPQDSTLFLVFQEPSIDIWKRKLDWVAQHGGMALVNVHPDYMNFDGRRRSLEYEAQLYQDFLEHVAKRYRHQCWFALPRDVARYVCDYIPGFHEPNGESLSTTSVAYPGVDRPDSIPSTHSSSPRTSSRQPRTVSSAWRLRGKRVAMVLFSSYPADPRPRRAAEALANEGMRVDLICLSKDEKDPKRETVNGIDILRIPYWNRRGSTFQYLFHYSTFILISFALLAMRSLTRRYDVVYVHNMPDILVLSSLVPKAFGAKVILDLHDPMPELLMTIFSLHQETTGVRFLKRLEKWSMALADSVLTVNLACKRLFASRSCLPEKIHVIMNTPDEQIFRFRPAGSHASTTRSPSKPFVIMYHGTLVERNGVDLAVDALARVRQSVPIAELRVYGYATPFLKRVMDSVRHKGLHEAVHYLGPKPLEDIVAAIGECDVGVIPNRRSVFTELNTPTRIFEYLALGKPVIAPRTPGVHDYFDDDSLLCFELGNSEDLARKIEYVFFHPSEAGEIVKRGQEVYLAHTWRQERLSLVNLTAELLSSRDRPNSAKPL